MAEATDPKAVAGIKALIDDQTKVMAAALGVSPDVAAKTMVGPPR